MILAQQMSSRSRTMVLRTQGKCFERNVPFTGEIEINGAIVRYFKGMVHGLDDTPAVEFDDGQCEHIKYGLLHRDPDLGPAVYSISGDFPDEYWMNGKPVEAPLASVRRFA